MVGRAIVLGGLALCLGPGCSGFEVRSDGAASTDGTADGWRDLLVDRGAYDGLEGGAVDLADHGLAEAALDGPADGPVSDGARPDGPVDVLTPSDAVSDGPPAPDAVADGPPAPDAGVSDGSGGDLPPVGSFGEPCTNYGEACADGLSLCFAFVGDNRGWCTRTCSNPGGLCPSAPSGTTAACGLEVPISGSDGGVVNFCVFVCEWQQQVGSCPDWPFGDYCEAETHWCHPN